MDTVKAMSTATVIDYTDVSNVKAWYLLVPRTSSAPTVSPTATETQMRNNGWGTIEPGVDTTKKLYKVDQCIFGDGTYVWGEVSLSSSYEAAIQAYNEAQAAKQTATNYIQTVTGDGIFVHSVEGGSSTSSGTGVHIGGAINIIKSGVSYIKAWLENTIPYIRIGREDKGNVLIDNDSVDIRDGTTVSASFGANLISLGNPSNSPHVEVTPNTMTFYDSNGGDSAAIVFLDDNAEKRFVVRSEQTSDDYAGIAMVSTDYAASDYEQESEVQLYASHVAALDGDDPGFSALRISGQGVKVDFRGDSGSHPFALRNANDLDNPYAFFKIDAFGYCTAATDGLLFSGSDALALFDVSVGTITSLAMYRYGKVIQLNVGFKNTESVASGANVLDATWAPGWGDDIKPINSVNGPSFYGKTPLFGSFTASNGHLVVRNASTAAVTVSSSFVTFTYIAKNVLLN